MLGENKFLQVQKLIGSGRSFRNISRTVGVDRKTVSRIARGKHAFQLRKERPALSPQLFVKTDAYRCPTCSIRVVLSPCPVCAAGRPPSPSLPLPSGPAPLGVNLRGEEKRRYLEVREKIQADIAAGRRRPLDGLHLDSH